MTAIVLKQIEQGSPVSLLTTELNSLANNSNAVSATAVLVNVAGGSNTDGYVRGKLELNLAAPAGSFTANTGLSCWFLASADGTNYEDGGSSVTPARLPDVVFPVRAVSTAQRLNRRVRVPVGSHKVLLRNDGTGQALNASGNTLKILLNTDEMV
jgi:hypothetical protein